MTTGKDKDALIAELDRVAGETLAYFDGPGRRTGARVDRWQARDVRPTRASWRPRAARPTSIARAFSARPASP